MRNQQVVRARYPSRGMGRVEKGSTSTREPILPFCPLPPPSAIHQNIHPVFSRSDTISRDRRQFLVADVCLVLKVTHNAADDGVDSAEINSINVSQQLGTHFPVTTKPYNELATSQRPAASNLNRRADCQNDSNRTGEPYRLKLDHIRHPQDMFPGAQMPSSLSYASSTIPVGFPYMVVPRASASAQAMQPIHPPALIRGCVALPTQNRNGSEARLHPLVQYRARAPYMKWDLSQSFEELTRTASSIMLERATQPALPSMTIVHPQLPWCITVHQSDSRGVTVGDVLRAIHMGVGERLEGGGGTRLQYLQGKKVLVGLRKSSLGGDVWEMIVV